MAKQLEKSQWRAYFDRMSKALVGKRAEIEVASLKLGDQIEAEWLPLLGISYDPKDDIIEIALEGVDHLIPKPREVYVEENGLELSSLEVIDAEGTHQRRRCHACCRRTVAAEWRWRRQAARPYSGAPACSRSLRESRGPRHAGRPVRSK